MTSQVTQCPSCQTSFRVTEAQLGIANGAVRCGSCLHIFNAPDHWLGNPQARVTPEETPAVEELAEVAPTEAATSDPSLEDLFNDDPEQDSLDDLFDDAMFADDDFDLLADSALDTLGEEPTTAEEEALSDDLSSLADANLPSDDADSDIDLGIDIDSPENIATELAELESETPSESEPEPETANEIELSAADSSAEAAIDDDDDDFLISDSIINTDLDLELELPEDDDDGELGFSDSFLQLNEAEDMPTARFKELDDIGGDEEAIKEEAWAQKLLEEDDEDEVAKQDQEPKPKVEADDTFSDLFDALENDQPGMDSELQDILNQRVDENYAPGKAEQTSAQPTAFESPFESTTEEEFTFGSESILTGERIGGNQQSLLHSIEPEPVMMAAPADRSRWVKRGWASSIIIAIMLFAGQHLVFNFDRLARDPNYRPILSAACDVIGCHIPSLDDVNQVLSSNLMVRSHPKASQALVVDAIIINRADFQQRFPLLELQFTDLNGNVIAGRRFTPNEYLAGELSGNDMMPIKQPVHISLEIVDPGEQAVNYQLRFYPLQGS